MSVKRILTARSLVGGREAVCVRLGLRVSAARKPWRPGPADGRAGPRLAGFQSLGAVLRRLSRVTSNLGNKMRTTHCVRAACLSTV